MLREVRKTEKQSARVSWSTYVMEFLIFPDEFVELF
jgi:hypothetical protein